MSEQEAANPNLSIPFAYGWYACDLREYRPYPETPATYAVFPYETLPPIPEADPSFRFLASDDTALTPNPVLDTIRVESRQTLDLLLREAGRLGLTVPDSFVRFMSIPELQLPIRSGTGCWFKLSSRFVRCPGFEKGYLVGFLRDQQDCVIWCLCLTPDGQYCVIAVDDDAAMTLSESDYNALLGDSDLGDEDAGEAGSQRLSNGDEVEVARSHIFVCAHVFELFIYRFWIEDEIGWKLGGLDKTPPTTEELRYLEHYTQLQRGHA